jgi:hypothetical protein
VSTLQRWEVFDHTAGAYCDPHAPADCEDCKRDGNVGDWYRAEDVDAELNRLNGLLSAAVTERAALVKALEPYIHWDCDHTKGCKVRE